MKYRIRREGDREVLRLVQLVTVPGGGEQIPVDDDTPEGTIVAHGGTRFRLTKEFGAFALEPVQG